MPTLYSPPFRKSNQHHNTFARAAVFEEFRGRDARALDYGDFTDRESNEIPPPADEFLDWLDLIGVGAIR